MGGQGLGVGGLEVTLEGARQAVVTDEVEDNGGVRMTSQFWPEKLGWWWSSKSLGCSGIGITSCVQVELLGRAGLEAFL